MADPPAEPIHVLNSSTLPRSAKRCKIPKLNRSTSARGKADLISRLQEPRPKSMTASTPKDLWDLGSSMTFSMDDCDSSVKSFGSFASFASSQADQSSRPISRNYYGKKFVLHCDRHLARQEDYLTPTQRKDKEIRQLKSVVMKQTRSCEEKDREIERLKGEMQHLQDVVTELQLNTKHISMNSSQDSENLDSLNAKISTSDISFESNSSSNNESTTNGHNDDIHVATNSNDDSGISNMMSLSLSPRHSSEFGDVVHDLIDCKSIPLTADKATGTDPVEITRHDCDSQQIVVSASPRLSLEFDKFLSTYKYELEELKSQHKEHYQDLKNKFNERVDDLLLKFTETNSRYQELRPIFDRTQVKIQDIETQLTEVQKDLDTQEDYHNQMYLKMYRKGQESSRHHQPDSPPPGESRVPELVRQLRHLESELERCRGDRQAEYTLRFLKDAVFYFLTKRDKDHLKAIQSILGFTDTERMAVAKAMKHRRL